jgi:hypothetical protein
MGLPTAKSSAITIWFRVGSLAFPQKMNLHSHIFKALYSTSDTWPSDMFLDIHLISNSCFHSFLPGGAFVFVRIHGSCDIKAGHHIYIGLSWRYWSMAKEKSIDTI